MITKIISSGLDDRVNIFPTIVKSLIGTWGINDNKEQSDVFLGRVNLSFAYDSDTLSNNFNDVSMCIAVYDDGTYGIFTVDNGTEKKLDKTFKMAILISKGG